MLYREIQVLHPIGAVDAATVAVGLLLEILAGLDIKRRILRNDCKVFYRREICYGQRQWVYSIEPLVMESEALTMPRLEFLMNSRMVSRSTDWGNPE